MNERIDPQQAKALLQRADRETETARGNASWPAIGLQLGLGACSSMYLMSIRGGQQDTTALVFLFAWFLFLILFSSVFSRAAKRGFGRRWLIYMLVWGTCWTVGVFAVFPHAALVCAIIIFVATMIGAIWEARS